MLNFKHLYLVLRVNKRSLYNLYLCFNKIRFSTQICFVLYNVTFQFWHLRSFCNQCLSYIITITKQFKQDSVELLPYIYTSSLLKKRSLKKYFLRYKLLLQWLDMWYPKTYTCVCSHFFALNSWITTRAVMQKQYWFFKESRSLLSNDSTMFFEDFCRHRKLFYLNVDL